MIATRSLSTVLLITTCTGAAQATEVAVCTDQGRFVIELADAQSPKHVENFLRYVDMGYYSGTVFHRVVSGYVVQAGGVDRKLRTRPTLPPVANESRNGLSNFRSSVAAARGADPDSATSQFFVNVEDNTRLDASKEAGYTVFGRVKEGIRVLDRISRLPTGAADPFRGDVPMPLPVILSIARLDAAALGALPEDNRNAAIKQRISAAAAGDDRAQTLQWIEHYHANCGAADPQISLIEARAALETDLRPRAVFVLQEYFAVTDQSDPSYQDAVALYRAAVPQTQTSAVVQVIDGCDSPQAPAIPDGSRASLDDMIAGQTNVHAFVAAGETYLACLTKIIDGKRRSVEQRDAATGEHDRMVEAMERVAADFNEQVRVFKARGD